MGSITTDERKILEYYGKEHNFIIVKFFETKNYDIFYVSNLFKRSFKSYSKDFSRNLIPAYYKSNIGIYLEQID